MNKLTNIYIGLLLIATPINAAEVLKELKNAKDELVAGKKEIQAGKQGVQDGYWKIKNEVITPTQAALAELPGQKSSVASAYQICKEVDSALKGLKYTVVFSPVANTAMGIFGNTSDIVGGLVNTLNAIEKTLTDVNNTIEPTIEPINPKTFLSGLQELEAYLTLVQQEVQNQEKWSDSFRNSLQELVPKLSTAITVGRASLDAATQEYKPSETVALQNALAPLNTFITSLAAQNVYASAPKSGQDDTIKDAAQKIITDIKTTCTFLINLLNKQPDVYKKFNQAEQDFDAAIQLLDQIVGDLTALFEAV